MCEFIHNLSGWVGMRLLGVSSSRNTEPGLGAVFTQRCDFRGSIPLFPWIGKLVAGTRGIPRCRGWRGGRREAALENTAISSSRD